MKCTCWKLWQVCYYSLLQYSLPLLHLSCKLAHMRTCHTGPERLWSWDPTLGLINDLQALQADFNGSHSIVSLSLTLVYLFFPITLDNHWISHTTLTSQPCHSLSLWLLLHTACHTTIRLCGPEGTVDVLYCHHEVGWCSPGLAGDMASHHHIVVAAVIGGCGWSNVGCGRRWLLVAVVMQAWWMWWSR